MPENLKEELAMPKDENRCVEKNRMCQKNFKRRRLIRNMLANNLAMYCTTSLLCRHTGRLTSTRGEYRHSTVFAVGSNTSKPSLTILYQSVLSD